jgi:hypothetical protein
MPIRWGGWKLVSSTRSSGSSFAAPSPPPVPTVVQHVASSCNPVGVGEVGNTYIIPIPNPVGLHNCIVLALTYPNGAPTSITDSQGNTWSTTPRKAAIGASNTLATFVLGSANAGQTSITVVFSAAVAGVRYEITEIFNCSGVDNGSSSAVDVTGPSLACGSIAPTSDSIVLAYFAESAGLSSGNPTSWVPGGSFTVLDADISGIRSTGGFQAFPASSQFLHTSATINPSTTATGDTADTFNCVAIALAAASVGTPKPAGIHIDKIVAVGTAALPATWHLQYSATGNLRIFVDQAGIIQSISDNESGSWTPVSGVVLNTTAANIWWSANKSPNNNLTISITSAAGIVGNPAGALFFLDVSGAAASPFDVSASASANATAPTSADQPDITPSTINGLVVAVFGNGLGPTTAVTSPSGAIADWVQYTGQMDGSNLNFGNGIAHLYNTTTAAENWTWTISTSQSVKSAAIAFKAA